jgi:hypothetical protein
LTGVRVSSHLSLADLDTGCARRDSTLPIASLLSLPLRLSFSDPYLSMSRFGQGPQKNLMRLFEGKIVAGGGGWGGAPITQPQPPGAEGGAGGAVGRQ